MSNIKRVHIEGTIPFNTSEHEELNRYLGFLNGPSMGLRISYNGRTSMGPKNQWGGRTTFYEFTVEGEEAVRAEFLSTFCKLVKDAGGTITQGEALDLEYDSMPTRVWRAS